ncbi:seryl-tRNA synthetase [Thermosporothrix hazakensis]|jgi:seryl-tRNA synthetase|uniref:Serine--tRNA ligase n=2 Tax=Thermosporothrix TaxID=768650 RepID=A0A326UE50_THEHA|nr:serine--tRNA ligase [Thermosporothrix hazakensis]PZW36566.1 seryl-tRNA synthetase [Thermosporothrix hazakensis]BBH89033.1 serine--tRNA ligase [Thermosporothrix sp. COM3]GCE47217.1 serine--tRNA ligase [Thermosporothrix hazakensis]
MLDLTFIRNNPDLVKEAARLKNNPIDIDALLELDRQVINMQQEVDQTRAQQKQLSKQIQQAAKEKNVELRTQLIAEGKQLSERLKALEPELTRLQDERYQMLLLVPNIPDPSAPIGKDEDDNVPIKYWGEKPQFDFEMRDHYELMQHLDLIDIERAVKVAGTRSYALRGDAARLELALIHFALDRLAKEGFMPLIVPSMARDFAFIGNGQFPKGRDQVYEVEDEDLFLVGTAEVSITGMYKDEILKAEELPLRFVGYSPCYRKEAGTYGKDTRGVFRVHQFNKVEQYIICKNDHEESVRWHEQLLRNAEELVQALELPYRVVNVCTGDMGDGKVGMYDLECWVPSENRYRETHSCSYLHDWQARRANIRYRDEDGKLKFVHTLNNTAIASPRILIPLLENHQQADGSVRIPEALRPYMGGQEYIHPKQ